MHGRSLCKGMRALRFLSRGVWYKIRSRINNREPLFGQPDAAALFLRVFREGQKRYGFECRLLHVKGDCLAFYVMPVDGYQLPAIMKWIKQVFAQRYNRMSGRCGHIWGDRYESKVLPGEAPEEGGGCGGGVAWVGRIAGVRPWQGAEAEKSKFLPFSLHFPLSGVPPPG
jgi:hypothetical protein